MTFAKWLAAQRNSRNLTQAELAERLGMHPRSISTWEIGKGLPNRNTLRRIAEFFGVFGDLLVAAVIDQRGDLPPIGNESTDLVLPPMLSHRIRSLAESVGMPPDEWLDSVIGVFEHQGESIRQLLPPGTVSPISRSSGVKLALPRGAREAAADRLPPEQ